MRVYSSSFLYTTFTLLSFAGRTRIEIEESASFSQLKEEIEEKVNVVAYNLLLYLDDAYKKKLNGSHTATIKSLGLK